MTDRHRLTAVALSVLFACWCAWRIITLSMATFLAEDDPRSALRWRARNADALVGAELARARLDRRHLPDAGSARAALSLAPLQPVAYRLLARRAELGGDAGGAARLYEIAAARGPRDLQSVRWVARRQLAVGNFAGALANLDQMMRVQPEVASSLEATLISVATYRPAQHDLAQLLEKDPPWRDEFVARLLARAPDSAAVFPLVEKLRTSPGGGLSDRELGLWIARLARDGQWGPAYLTWVQSLSPEASRRVGNVYNGGFELEPSGIGFDWQFKNVPGARISREQVDGADESLALRIEFEGERVQFGNVRQMLALAPGDYRLRGRVRLDDLRTGPGLVWTVRCVTGRRELGATLPMSGRSGWRSFEMAFTVPADNCGGQWLSLSVPARSKAEQRIGGVAWFDDLSIKSE